MNKQGTIIKRHPHLHDVKLESGRKVKAYVSGEMAQNKISVLEGDTVQVEIEEGAEKGRIVYRGA